MSTTDAAALIAEAEMYGALIAQGSITIALADNERAVANAGLIACAPLLITRLASALEASIEREGRLREALKPFAAAAAEFDEHFEGRLMFSDIIMIDGSWSCGEWDGKTDDFIATVGDFRRARKALGDAT